MSSLRPRPRCVLLLHASAALLFLFLGTEPAAVSVLGAELRRMGERDEVDMSPQCNPPLPAAALILFLLDLRLHHPCEPGSSQREGVGCPTDEAIPIPMFVPTSLNNAPQIALPTLPTQAPRKYEHTLHFLLLTSAIPPYHHPLAARLGHLVISVFESPSDLGALRPTSYQQVPCWGPPRFPTYLPTRASCRLRTSTMTATPMTSPDHFCPYHAAARIRICRLRRTLELAECWSRASLHSDEPRASISTYMYEVATLPKLASWLSESKADPSTSTPASYGVRLASPHLTLTTP
ncbi:hypothetical protein GQ607_006128 [Colletotrichum asianum]|uniref:Uncharacterized protein n=1 Tax=Colletotrichum asianum TaxID=702518 RepID=A0A8H3WHK2_9PEZI|nr:hypothetical protein GQ607_006128 [Colletotrichum asianum]